MSERCLLRKPQRWDHASFLCLFLLMVAIQQPTPSQRKTIHSILGLYKLGKYKMHL